MNKNLIIALKTSAFAAAGGILTGGAAFFAAAQPVADTALAGAGTAAAQYVQANGPTQNWQQVLVVAGLGALTAVGAAYMNPPNKAK